MKKKTFLFFLIITILEVANYYWSGYFAPSEELGFQLAARYSARFSFVIFCIILTFTGLLGLNKIYSSHSYRRIFIALIGGFALNHLIHFYFLTMNHIVQGIDLLILKNAFGSMAYLFLSFVPVYFWKRPKVSVKEYWTLQIYLLIISSFFIGAYVKRMKEEIIFPSSEALLITHGVILVSLLILNIYRVFQEKSK